MKNFLVLHISLFLLMSFGCTSGQTQSNKNNLPPKEFSEKLNQLSGAVILDVRTPGEYADGHLINAMNVDWNGDDFDAGIKTIDKSTPVFVYCQAGGRSASAAKKMRSEGYKEVYELKGGFEEWQAAKLPETK